MTSIEQLYRDFAQRIADACEEEANRYAQHPQLEDSDHQYIRVLRERCRQWKREVAKLDAAYHGHSA